MVEATLLGDVPRQFLWRPRRRAIEALGLAADQTAEPHVTEVHQLAVLHIAEVGRVREYAIEAVRRKLDLPRVGTVNADGSPTTVGLLTDPFTRDRHLDVA